jgi:hypothetical protein
MTEDEAMRAVIDTGRALLDGLGRCVRAEQLFDLEEAFERALRIAENLVQGNQNVRRHR